MSLGRCEGLFSLASDVSPSADHPVLQGRGRAHSLIASQAQAPQAPGDPHLRLEVWGTALQS